jgi:two-component system KDP operon response regulator KdpE
MLTSYGVESGNRSIDLSLDSVPDHVLVVDDDRETLKLLSLHLKKHANKVTTVLSGTEALKVVRRDPPDLILLDLMMPQFNGFQVCKAIRANYQMPIIVISALEHEQEKVKALDLGADDYLTKPYGSQELLARIRAVMRRTPDHLSRKRISIKLGPFIADLNSGDVSYSEKPIQLTSTEFKLLTELLLHSGESIRHEQLLDRVWGSAYTGNVEYLHMYISRLRKKLDMVREFSIITSPGIGYKLQINED